MQDICFHPSPVSLMAMRIHTGIFGPYSIFTTACFENRILKKEMKQQSFNLKYIRIFQCKQIIGCINLYILHRNNTCKSYSEVFCMLLF